MALFESLVPQQQQRTNRGDEVERLLEALLAEIADPACGGLAGFLAHFSDAGFSGLVQSWLEHDAYAIASAAQIRYSLGDALLARLASAAGMSAGTAAMVLALMIPSVVYRLTPGGRVPNLRELSDLMEGRSASTNAAPAEGRDRNAATPGAANERTWLARLRTLASRYGLSVGP